MKTIREFEHAGWERAAAAYDRSFASVTRLFVDALLDAGEVMRGRRVLDVGCGPGIVTHAAGLRGANCVGIDFAGAMIREARTRHPHLHFQQADAEHIPFGDATFDAVVSNMGIHHVERPQTALAEALRVLRAAGRLAFTVWESPDNNPGWGILNAAIRAHGNPEVPMPAGDSTKVGSLHLAEAAAAAGFADITCTPLERPWRLPDGLHLMEIFAAGTVRTANLIAQQSPGSIGAIRAAVDAALAPYTEAGVITIPARGVLIRAGKAAG